MTTGPLPTHIFGFRLQPIPTDEEMVPANMVSQMDRYRSVSSGTLTCCGTTWKLWHDEVEERLCWLCNQPGRDLNELTSEERAAVPGPSPSSAQMNLSESQENSP